MRTTHILMLCSLICLFFGHPLNAQICGPEPVVDSTGFEGSAFFNYGSSARIKSTTYRSAVAVGQTFIGYTENVNKNSTLGFYARYFLPPFALKVKATQGDLLDRIQVTWEIDALGPSPNDGFNIYRDGIFLQTVGANIRSYNDFNVIAGRPYRYCVQGLNLFGEGVCSEAIGFQVPNGVVTGWVSTQNGTAVPGATVILTPMQGFSAKFDAGDGAFAMSETGTNPFLPALDSNWTMTFWIKTTSATNNAKLIAMKSSSLYLRALNSPSGHEGVVVATTSGGTPFLSAQFPDSTKNEWHHLALTYDGNNNKGRLYLDGVLAAIAPMNPILSPDTLNFGALAGSGTWKGRLDEVR
ncbi:MAG TPA: LamG domain-containing protein, partial [Saprospiraceae bacterium]|nr:LamG domain-containing protein [Saprospiraceae bacterium]